MNKATFRSLVWGLVVGISQSRLYAAKHDTVTLAAGRLLEALGEFPDAGCTLLVVKGDIVVNNTLFRDSGMHGEKLLRFLAAKGVSRIDILQGAREEEIIRLFADLARADERPGSYLHVRLGVVEAGLAGPDDPGAAAAVDAYHTQQLARVQEVYAQVSPFRELSVVGLEEIVTTFLLTFRRGANLLRLICPVKSHSDHTYTHAVNVSVLAMALAERIGLREATVQEIGIAALLHDVGKLLIPLEILHKPGSLSSEEFKVIAQHPLYGAAYLARVEGLPPLAVLVALEHHLKYDTSGYPAPRESGRRQHAASQIVAVADFYDALRSHRPYRRSLSMQEILSLMRKDAGTAFNPWLVENFSLVMLKAASEL